MLLTAVEATKRLGVKPATLYAYVSRGLVRSAPGTDKRARRYYADDIERLRHGRHKGPRRAKPPQPYDTLTPVLDTSLSLIERGQLFYGGQDAVTLSLTCNLEDIATLLWQARVAVRFSVDARATTPTVRSTRQPPSPLSRVSALLLAASGGDDAAFDTSAESVRGTASRIVPLVASAVTGSSIGHRPLHLELAAHWRLDSEGADLIRRCLVLVADHELNPSTYVARCIASTGATPYAVMLGAIASLSGPKHGGEVSRVEHLLRGMTDTRSARRIVTERLQRGERIPGFGLPLYPDGDPRARALIEALCLSAHGRRAKALIRVSETIATLIQRPPTVDFALGLIATVLRLPPGSGLSLFLIGRTVGWMAHALEQYAMDTIIRPRARYVGLLPH